MKTPAQMVDENLGAEITGLVESYWRAFLAAGSENPALAVEVSRRFEAKVEEIAAGLGAEPGQAFRAAVERERERLLKEYEADRAAFRRRLGVPALPPAQPSVQRGSIAETVARTAVRATVWETVRAIFRAFR